MKLLLTLITLSLLCLNGKAQKPVEDKISKKTLKSISLLTEYLTLGMSDKHEKVEAIYTWITENIEYDYALIEGDDYFTGIDPTKVLKSKKAICSGYVELMKAMLDHAGIVSETINGYTRDVSWSPGQLVMVESHAWIGYKIKEQWYLADPTWDAGYIGRIPTHSKPYKAKEYKEKVFKSTSQEEKVLTKRAAKEEKRKKAYDSKPKYSKKIGFVRQPTYEYFNLHTDTFLLTHLPINPIWQMRSNIISIEEFSTTEDSIILHLSNNKGLNIDYLSEIENYQSKDYLHQLLINGEDGFDYNQYNPSVKAMNYYNFMALISNKNVQKLARGSIYEITPAKYEYLRGINDTVIKYGKLYKTFEKGVYKENRTYDKSNYKATTFNDKNISKNVLKMNKENEKLIAKIHKNFDVIESNLMRIVTDRENYEMKFPGVVNYERPADLDTLLLGVWKDSILLERQILQDLYDKYDTLRSYSSINDLLSNIQNINYLFQKNAEFIQFNSYSNNEIIDHVDSLLYFYAAHSNQLYKDSIPLEIMGKDVMNSLKNGKNYMRGAKADLRILLNEGKITSITPYETYMLREYMLLLNLAEEANLASGFFNEEVDGILKNHSVLNSFEKQMEDQTKLKEDKNAYVIERTETEHRRSEKLIERIQTDAGKWKETYKKPKG